jgi:prevent-host-death family protein
MSQVELHEAKTTLSQLVDRAAAGEDIVIARNGIPVVRLVPVGGTSSLASVRGAWRGQIELAEDFDELPGLSKDAAMRLAVEAQHATRPARR